jgi:hypothetical protein
VTPRLEICALLAVFVFKAMEILPWKLFMHPLKTPGNISMYQGKQMKYFHGIKWEKLYGKITLHPRN